MIWLHAIPPVLPSEDDQYRIWAQWALTTPSYRHLTKMTAEQAEESRRLNAQADPVLFAYWRHGRILMPEGWRR